MPKESQQFGRLITAMVTPFDDSGEFSAERTRTLARHLVDTGTESIVVAGTTGESPTLTERERMLLVGEVLREVGHECRVIAGTSTYDTAESMELSKLAQTEGAHGLLLVTPYYNKPSQNGLYSHFAAIAESVDLPIILYNVPSRTNVNMRPDTVLRLDVDFRNIVGLKEAVGMGTPEGRTQLETVIDHRETGFQVWSGNDQDTFFIMEKGGYGVVSVASHICGSLIRRMIEHQISGERDEAEELNRRMMRCFEALFPPQSPEPSPSAIKASLNDNGILVGGLRLPVLSVPNGYRSQLQVVMTECGLNPRT